MSELTVTLLRLGYLVLLWAFVLSAISVLRRDLYGTRIVRRTRRGATPAPGARTPRPAPQPAPEPEPVPVKAAPARSSARPQRNGPSRLVITTGPLRGTTLPLGTSAILVGRAPSCTLVLDDEYTSSRHARIYPQTGQWFVEDLGSTNGTFVNDSRVEEPTVVEQGASIRVGQSLLELQR